MIRKVYKVQYLEKNMKNKKGYIDESIILFIFFILISIIVVFCVISMIVDSAYTLPKASEKANNICKDEGYDFYDSFKRIGLFSSEPVAIKCKYVDNYKDVDMNIRRESGGENLE